MIEESFCCLNHSCGCGQNEKLHNEIHNTLFELTDAELLKLSKKRPYQYIKVHFSCECSERGDVCFCWDNRNFVRRAEPNEMTPERIAKLEKFREDWFKNYDNYKNCRGVYARS